MKLEINITSPEQAIIAGEFMLKLQQAHWKQYGAPAAAANQLTTPQPTVGQNGGSAGPVHGSPAGDLAGNAAGAEGGLAPGDAPAATVTEKPKRGRKSAELKDDKVVVTQEQEAGNGSAATAASDSTAASTTEPAAPAAGSHSLDDVRAALQVYTEKHGMQKGIDLLKQYGANRISELATDQYGLFIEECKGA